MVQAWRAQAIKGVWLKLPTTLSHLVPLAVGHGFEYHHAEKGYVMMTAWLPETSDTLPPNASHQVGIGAVVSNSHREILVVKERSGPAAALDIWKLPTGLLNTGEDYSEAAVREVKEETVRPLLVRCSVAWSFCWVGAPTLAPEKALHCI
jgi:hypothetical protein